MPAFTLGTIGCGAECECSAPPCDTVCPLPCDPCPIPAHDLFASVGVNTYTPAGCAVTPEICGVVILSGTDAFGFTDLVFDGVDEWVSPTITYQASYLNNLYQPTGPDPEDVCTFEYVFTLKCDAGTIKLFADHVGGTCTDWRDSIVGSFVPFASGETPIEASAPGPGGITRTCLPFNVTFELPDSTAEPPAGGRVSDVCPPVNVGCCPVEFTVVDCFNDPLPGVYVKVEDGFGNPEDIRADGTTDGSGVVTLDILQAGTYTVTVAATGFTAADIALACEGAYEIAADECCIVTLTILDCNGDPIVGADVEILGEGGVIVASGTTDGSGVVVLNIAVAGTYDVVVDAAGFSPTSTAMVCDGTYTFNQDPSECPTVPCGACDLLAEDASIAWTNVTTGDSSATLVFDGVTTWKSSCYTGTLSGGPYWLSFQIRCEGDVLVMGAYSHPSDACAGTGSAICTLASGLTLTSSSCSPFLYEFDVENSPCPILYALGFRTLTFSQ